MNDNEYILDLYDIYKKQKDNKHLSKTEKKILQIATENEKFTAYICHKEIKKVKKIAYSNIHRPIQKLYHHGFLTKILDTDTKHGSVFYKLSPYGLFYIFLHENAREYDLKKLFYHHKNNKTIGFCLFRFLEKKTFDKIDDRELFVIFFDFLKKFYMDIQDMLIQIQLIEKYEYKVFPYLTVNSLFRIKTKYDEELYFVFKNTNDFIKFLKQEFRIRWLNSESVNIKEVEKNKSIKITDSENLDKYLELKLDYKKEKAILCDNNSELFEFDLRSIPNTDIFYLGKNTLWLTLEECIKTFLRKTDNVIRYKIQTELLFPLFNLFHYHCMNSTKKLTFAQTTKNLQYIFNDRIFIKTFKMLRENLNKTFDRYEEDISIINKMDFNTPDVNPKN